MENLLIMLIIVAVAGISNWLQRKAQAAEQGTEDQAEAHEEQGQGQPMRPPQHGQPPPLLGEARQPRGDLAGELRRLFENQPAQKPPSLPPQPPPQLQPQLQPARQLRQEPPTVLEPLRRPRPAPPQPAKKEPRRSMAVSNEKRLEQNRELKAHQLQRFDDLRAARIAKTRAPKEQSALVPGELRSIYGVAESPQAARQAFIASLVFGAPKAFES
jgi:hypothetical protein